MAIRPVLRIGDPRLRRPSAPVPPEAFGSDGLRALIDDLRDTMAARDGAGLAAPQIGVPLRVVIFGLTHNPRYPEAPPIPETVLINPVLTPLGQDQDLGGEGCLSVPGLRAQVPRWRRLRYEARDPEGRALVREVDGFHARVVQHECDHLDGVLFPDRLAPAAPPGPGPDPAPDPLGAALQEGELLGLHHTLFRRQTLEAARQAGVAPGLRMLVVGADTGAACLDLARLVGPAGRILALVRRDADRQALRLALSAAAESSSLAPVEVRRHDPLREALPREGFDLAWCPGAALHLGDPLPLVRELGAALRPGGRLWLQATLSWDGFDLAPEGAAIRRLAAGLRSSIAAAGGDPEVGRCLPDLLVRHGFRLGRLTPRLRVGGPGSPAARWLEESCLVLASRLVRRGFWREEDRSAVAAAAEAARRLPGACWVGPLDLTIEAERDGTP